jgi:hypothetical protein
LHPRIHRYLYVRHVLRERLVSEANISPDRVQFWGNTVDVSRVGQPKVLPHRPRTAGVYGHVGKIPFLDALAAGCGARGIMFLGELLGGRHDPNQVEKELSRCDLVFASGRMAIEALAAGTAVINADRFGIGGMITRGKFDDFLMANFAIGALSMPPTEAAIAQALDAYDAEDAAAVTARVRHDCDIAAGAERLETIYQSVLDEAAAAPADRANESAMFARYLEDNLQRGRLYNGEFARRAFAPVPAGELAAIIRRLEVTVEHLDSVVSELSRRGFVPSLERLLRALRTWWRSRGWRAGMARFADWEARKVPQPGQTNVELRETISKPKSE